MTTARKRWFSPIVAALGLVFGSMSLPAPALGQAQTPTTVTISGGAQGAAQTVPTGGQRFGVRVPLKPNAENTLSLSAADTNGRTAQVNDLKVAQISLTDIVRATVTAQRLTTTEVKQLVAQGTINIADPENYNVSRFVVALVVNGREVQVSVPVARQKQEPMAYGPEISIGCSQNGEITSTERAIAIPCGGGGSEGKAVDTPLIIPFEIAVPGVPEMPGIPGVILIEGRIKTLKEFFKVNLLLMNVSPLFTLTDLSAHLELPEGMLSGVAPAGGTIALTDIGPGTDTTGQFIIRGDTKGTHTITAHFGGKIAGAFLPEPVPFSGSASTDLEVKGPPKMDVKVSHPDYVTAGTPYELTVEIHNTDTELDALYTSLAIDVGGGAQLLDETTGFGLSGGSVRSVGDILRGETIVQRYRVMPLVTGAITSCVGAADENIQLSVEFTGRNIGCAIGTLPPERLSPDGHPTVTVVPSHNTVNVSVDPAITAIFSQKMIEQTVTTGYASASFNVLDEESKIVGGSLQFTELFGATAAIFRPASPLAFGKTYTIVVNPSIFSLDGLALASGIVARFSTEGAPAVPDELAPAVTVTLESPLVSSSIARGQTAPLVVEATDAHGVVRVDLLLDDVLIDAKTSASPARFLVETKDLLSGTTHVLSVRAFDPAGNTGTKSLSITIAPDVTPPTAAIVNDATVGGGLPLPVTVNATDDGRVEKVELYLDARTTPVGTGMVPPFQFAVATIGLSAGTHTLRAVVTDGASNFAEVTSTFSVVVDATVPLITLVSPQATRFRTGVPIAFVASATDNTGVASIEYRLDQELSPRSTGTSGFTLDTRTLTIGAHVMTIVAIDTSGNAATLPVAFEITTTPTDTTPPLPANTSLITLATSPTGGASAAVTVTGATAAVEASASVVITNTTTQAGAMAFATAAGAFSAQIEAAGGQTLSLVVVDPAGNRSAAVTVLVPDSVTLTTMQVSPSPIALSRSRTSQLLTVIGTFSDHSQRPVTSGLTFTSSAPAIASANAGGLVMPGQNGSAIITVASAVAGVASVQVPVTVNFSTLTGISAEPNPLTIAGVGRSQRLTVQARFSDNTTGPFSGTLRFGTANPNIAVVDGSGMVTGIAEGSTTITVSSNGLPSVFVLVVVQSVQPTALLVQPNTVAFTSLDATQALSINYQYSDGSSGAGAYALTFVSADTRVASVSSAGVITARGEGTTTIAVQALTFSVTVPVSVTLPATLPAPEITALGRPIAGEGDRLAILGRNFAGTPQQNFVTVGGLRADVVGASFDRLIALVPRGAASGIVQVRVAGQDSNQMPLSIYARRAEAVLSSAPFDARPAQAGQTADLGSASFYVQPGDRLLLTGDPNTIAGPVWTGLVGPTFGGMLVLTVNGVDHTFSSAAQSIDLASLLPALSAPTLVTINARLEANGTDLWSRGLALIAGPPDTGAFVGERFLLGDTLDQQMVLRFRVAAPNGTKYAATAQNWYRLSDGGFGNNSAGGAIVDGTNTPNDSAFRTLTVVNGEVAVTYSDTGVFSELNAPRLAVVSLLPADGAGNRQGTTPVAEAKVLLGGLDSASIIPQEPSTLADGVDRPIAVDITGVRDSYGRAVTNGTRLAVTAQYWYRRSDGGYGNDSAGGIVSGGVATPNDGGFRTVTLANGAAQFNYSAGNLVFATGTTRQAILGVMTAAASGDRQTVRPFAEGAVQVSAASGGTASITALPNRLAATTADNRSVITVSGLTDASGRLVPDGTRVAVTAGVWYRASDGGYSNGSFGGTILGGANTPNDGAFSTFTVSGGQVVLTYSNAGLVLGMGETATTIISFLPADGAGNRLGTTPFSDVHITQAGLTNATITATPSSTIADGGRRPITIAVTNIVDALGNVVPDGTRIALSAAPWYRRSDGLYSNGSAGGTFLDGTPASNDGAFFVYTVANGRVTATYSAETVPLLGTNDVRSTVIAATVASPANNRVTVRPFGEGALAVSGIATGTVTVTPTSLLADRQDRTAVVSLSGMTDAQGRAVPDGSKVAMTATAWYRASDGGYSNESAGGTMTGGAATPNNGIFRTYGVTGGGATASYSSAGLFVEPGGTTSAIVSVLTASPDGSTIGSQPFLAGTVTLTSVDTATFVASPVVSPGGTVNVTLTNIRDSAGNLVPEGTRIAVTAANWYNRDGSYPNSSAGGGIAGGQPTPNDGSFRTFVVSGGSITFSFTAPGSPNVTSVLSIISADAVNNRNTHRPFASLAIRVQ